MQTTHASAQSPLYMADDDGPDLPPGSLTPDSAQPETSSVGSFVPNNPKVMDAPARVKTRSRSGIFRALVPSDGTIRYASLASTSEPSSLHEPLGDVNWKNAMDAELDVVIHWRVG